jgi:hypothetical protein
MNNKKKLDILLDRWRDEMNGHLTRGAVDEALCVSGAEPFNADAAQGTWAWSPAQARGLALLRTIEQLPKRLAMP